ncbi:MAG: hypothetical protein L7W43_08755 [Rubripirellula sp.]|nr:hypothetical protein [Rubripirellula sp.]
MQNETILNVFPASDDLHRLVIAVQQEEGHSSSRLVLRQETYADDVGWFVQSFVAIEPEQVAGLKMALSNKVSSRMKTAGRDAGLSRVPAILSFDGSLSGTAG